MTFAPRARALMLRPRGARSAGADEEKDMSGESKGTALVTGASSGIGAIYADRLAARGYDLILVARNHERLTELAKRLAAKSHRRVDVIVADLAGDGLAKVEAVLRRDASISLLVNNAGIGAASPLLSSDVDKMDEMLAINVRAPMRLTYAVVPGFVERGGGAIINIASIVGVAPEILNGVYGGTKAFVLAFSLSLQKELAEQNVRVQAVLPGATATDLWELAGVPIANLPAEIVMKAEDMVDAALAGFDQGELVTLPSLPDIADWDAYEAARQKLMPNLSRNTPAARYRQTAAA
jgi:short-subunit dehydrogenase